MDWKNYFGSYIIERGRSFYNSDRVRNLSYDNDVYKAQVVGSAFYDVEIKIRDEKIISMKCSCPQSVSGQKCMHMAAVMFAIEKENNKPEQLQAGQTNRGQTNRVQAQPGQTKHRQVQPQSRTRMIRPFQASENPYQYFDMKRIVKNMEFFEQNFVEAKRLIHDKRIVLDSVEFQYYQLMGGTTLCGAASGHYQGDGFPVTLTMLFTRDSIIRANCEAPRCGGSYQNSYYFYDSNKICKHLLALMLLLEQYLKKYNPGDSTDRQGTAFFRGFRNQHVREVLEQQTEQVCDLNLESVLEKGRDGLYASFKVGTEKLYVLKNLPEFVKLYENKSKLSVSPKAEIDLARHRVCESSKAVLAYIQHIVKEELNREKNARRSPNHYYDSTEEIKSRIELYGERLDQFYDLYEGKEVAGSDKTGRKSEKTVFRFQEAKPDIRLQIEKDIDEEQVFHGVHVKGNVPDFIWGSNYRYFFAKDSFCRISDEWAREMKPLFEVGKFGDFSFRVGRKHLSEFYHQILPMLKQSVTVKEVEPESIEAYIPPKAVFVFYLDAENGKITCRPKARYGENTVSLLDVCREDCVYEAFRNVNLEEEIVYYLRQLFQEVDAKKDEMHCEESEDAMVRLLEGGVDRLLALGEVHTTDRFRSINIRKKPKLKVGVSIESDILNLSVFSEEIDQEELLQILLNYRRRKKYYRLKNGDFIGVNETDMEMLGQMMETLQLSPGEFLKGDMKLPMYRALYLNKMLEQGEDIYLNRNKHFKDLIKEFKTVDDSDFEVPASLAPIMRNYQVRGFKWMKTLEHYGFGGILADDMGLGKTLQMISVLLSAKENGELGTALIVCPASLVYNWNEEFARFAPELKVTLVVGSQQERAELIQNCQNSDVLVTSYDLLKRDIAEYENVRFQYQVLDEAQYIKNHNTAAAKSVKIIKSKHRYALTGTPIENRLSELWSIFDYLMPGFLYGYETFRRELETPIVKYKEENASSRLRKMVAPFILRRLKGDVLKDLPDKMEEIRYAKLENEQQKLYDGQVLHMKNLIDGQNAEDFQKNKLQILAELTKIRQICCDPELLFEKYQGGSAKRMACMELIQSAIEGEHKMLVFSQFTSMLELLEQDLRQENIPYYKITGATPKEKRVEMVSAFNNDSIPVFLISLKAGGTGLNLTGADVVIHYDPWWNQAAQNQATDRAHRIGQTKVVSVYKLIVKDTIEEKIVKMQESKRDLADSVLGGEMGGIAQMSKEDLLELLAK